MVVNESLTSICHSEWKKPQLKVDCIFFKCNLVMSEKTRNNITGGGSITYLC